MVGPIINSVVTTKIFYKKPHNGLPRAMFSAVHFVNGLEIGSGVITGVGVGVGGGGRHMPPQPWSVPSGGTRPVKLGGGGKRGES